MSDVSPELLSFKDKTPEEIAAEKARDEAEKVKRDEAAFVAEVAALTRRALAMSNVPPQFVLAAALDRHTAAVGRLAKAHESLAEHVETLTDLYRDHLERDVRGAK